MGVFVGFEVPFSADVEAGWVVYVGLGVAGMVCLGWKGLPQPAISMLIIKAVMNILNILLKSLFKSSRLVFIEPR